MIRKGEDIFGGFIIFLKDLFCSFENWSGVGEWETRASRLLVGYLGNKGIQIFFSFLLNINIRCTQQKVLILIKCFPTQKNKIK